MHCTRQLAGRCTAPTRWPSPAQAAQPSTLAHPAQSSVYVAPPVHDVNKVKRLPCLGCPPGCCALPPPNHYCLAPFAFCRLTTLFLSLTILSCSRCAALFLLPILRLLRALLFAARIRLSTDTNRCPQKPSPEPRLFLSACGVADLHPPPPFPLPRLRPPHSVLSYLATTLPACLHLHVLSSRLEISRTTSPHLLLHPDASSSASFPHVNPISQSTFKGSATNGNVVETHKEYVSSPRLSCADCIAFRHCRNPVSPGALVLNADTPG